MIENVTIPKEILDDIRQLYKTPMEIERVTKIIEDATMESLKKKIQVIREKSGTKRFLAKWYIRFKYGLHWSKPFYPVRVIRNHLKAWFYRLIGSDKIVLRGLEFSVTYKCNFQCSHCLCARIEESSTRKELTPAEYEDLVKQTMKLGATTYGMEGGEPFVVPNWDEFIQAWRPKYNHIIISTNGYMLMKSGLNGVLS